MVQVFLLFITYIYYKLISSQKSHTLLDFVIKLLEQFGIVLYSS